MSLPLLITGSFASSGTRLSRDIDETAGAATVTPEQVKRFYELAGLIASERGEEKVKRLAAELQILTTLELEVQSRIPPEAMPSWLCSACGISLREHTTEMIKQCTRRVFEVARLHKR